MRRKIVIFLTKRKKNFSMEVGAEKKRMRELYQKDLVPRPLL